MLIIQCSNLQFICNRGQSTELSSLIFNMIHVHTLSLEDFGAENSTLDCHVDSLPQRVKDALCHEVSSVLHVLTVVTIMA